MKPGSQSPLVAAKPLRTTSGAPEPRRSKARVRPPTVQVAIERERIGSRPAARTVGTIGRIGRAIESLTAGPAVGARATTAFVLRLASGAVFVVFGVAKFTSHEQEADSFEDYGLPSPDAFAYAIGVVEVVGGLLLLIGLGTPAGRARVGGGHGGAIIASGIGEGEAMKPHPRPGPAARDGLPDLGRAREPRPGPRAATSAGPLVDQDRDAVADRLGVAQPQRLLVEVSPNIRLPRAEDDREDHQPHLVDEVVLEQRLRELGAAVDDDVAVVRFASFATSAARSPSITVVFVHSGSVSVEETTYLGMLLNLSANSPVALRPGVGEALVGRAAEQQRVGAASSRRA